ncbi:hypothetical protein [Tanticharoenia sakaeratensis]|uniref:Lipoprotein n=1 Tax=Tanticharoenia sakaeratensis NBRC 103193 TaxID=1231623 RepID=A0A0D6MK65_9PROT|nr:hypothetical protein [Tanticharoenia sakaeratensis]GAN53830.1 hypothetical protein Tasa_012_006 [Tanticharoenia sakaeratensis NBRC 103193]GBQ25022.1 hypothetical protein AA103193_2939 [Tanticharoenia sakaeratensis NBRC 103193]
MFPRLLPSAAILLAASLGLAACSSGPPDPARDPIGIWTGALVTDDGTCPTERNSTLQISARDVSFTPGDGSIVLKGHRGADPNKYHAQLLLQDANHHPLAMVFNGLPVGQAIGGTYGTPSCRAHVTLTRPKD